MKKLIKACGALVAIAVTGWFLQPALAEGGQTIRMKGEFVWSGDKTQTKTPVHAVLTPRAGQEYGAVYTFTWKNKMHTYRGTVQGTLQSGEVTGTGDVDDQARKFTFKGTATNGAITAKCFELKGGKEVPQGTLELKN